jgi:DNA-binding transcriptional MerR regulator
MATEQHKQTHDIAGPQNGRYYGAKDVCRNVGISHRQLDYWVLIGVVTPYLERHGAKQFRRFSQQDVNMLQRIKKLTDEGVVVSRAAERVRRDMMREHGEGSATADAVEAPDRTRGEGEYVPDNAEQGHNGDL